MPKKSIEINPFDGGLNNFADARDIKENELAAATNLSTDQAGRIKIGKRIHTMSARTGAADIQSGLGLFHYNSDFNALNSEAYTEYQVMFNSATNGLVRRESVDTNWNALVSLGAAYTPCYYSIDGILKMSDQALVSDSKFFGMTDVNYFGEAQNNFFTSTNAYIDPPTDGDITINPGDETDVPPNQNTGHLDWVVQTKTGSKADWFSFNSNDSDNENLEYLINQYGQSLSSSNGIISFSESSYNSGNGTYILTSDGSITDNGSNSSDTMFKVTKGNTATDYNRLQLRFTNAQSYEEKSVFVDVYFPSAAKNLVQSSALKIRIGNTIQIVGKEGNDCYIYYVGSGQLNADAWTTLEFKQGEHDEVEGEPNASGLYGFMMNVDYQSASSSTDQTYYIDNLKIGESSRGLWNGRFKFYQSYIYDNSQESNTFLLNGQTNTFEVENKILEFRCHAKRGSGAAMAGSRRVTGANLYYSEFDLDGNPLDTDKRILANVDMEKGIKKVSGETYQAWGDAKGASTGFECPRNATNTNYLQIMDPPVLETFSTNAGYDEDDKLQKMKYKSVAIMNRRAYVGNVKITDSVGKDIKYSDRIYKSEPNKVDLFTELSYVDVAINDGESVTALASLGDMLLQFKERTMYLINCTQEIEYLEDTAKFRGVWGQAAVCETDEGIVWVNKFGLFLFDGKEITPLIEGKIDPVNWDSIIGGKPIVGFTPLDRKVLIVGDADAASKGFTYSLKSKGFNFITGDSAGNLFTADMTNLVSSNVGVLSWYQDSGSTITEYKWDTATEDVYIDIQSRDQDFKDPARRKMVKNVYLTYKVPSLTMSGTLTNASGNVTVSSTTNIVAGMTVTGTNVPANTTVSSITSATVFVMSDNASSAGAQTLTISGLVPTIKFRTNGRDTDYSFNSALLATDSGGNWYTKVLKPATSSQANNVYSFQVRLYGSTDKDFEINDINVVYRDKVLK